MCCLLVKMIVVSLSPSGTKEVGLMDAQQLRKCIKLHTCNVFIQMQLNIISLQFHNMKTSLRAN